jgi:hypothetical protein
MVALAHALPAAAIQDDAQGSFNHDGVAGATLVETSTSYEDAEAVTAKTAVIRASKEKIESLISSAATRSAREPPCTISTRAPTTLGQQTPAKAHSELELTREEELHVAGVRARMMEEGWD